MDSRPIREVIETYDEHRMEIKISNERQRLDKKMVTIKRNVDSILRLPSTLDSAWEILDTLQGLTSAKFEKYPTQELFFEAVCGFKLEDSKEDYDFCSQYKEDYYLSQTYHNEYAKAMSNYSDSLTGKYQMHILRERLESNRHAKPKPKN